MSIDKTLWAKLLGFTESTMQPVFAGNVGIAYSCYGCQGTCSGRCEDTCTAVCKSGAGNPNEQSGW